MNVAAWLESLGLGRYARAFAENDIDAEVLSDLRETDLERLGVASLGHRKRLLKAISALGDAPEAGAAPLSAGEAERRQLTVMFVDLVGSTALSGRLDPEAMRAVLTAYQNAVAGEILRLEGHIGKFMGDGVLAYFGWPRAHEDEAERAVRAGLAVVDAVAALETSDENPSCRVGIATGLVVVGDLVGEGAAQEEAVVGETPNLAARLQGLAAPGEVFIAEGTRRLVGDVFELEDRGKHSLKGIDTPVHAFAVTGERPMETRFEARGAALLPMVGRDQELALLLDRWRQATAGEGQCVLLTGEAGIGKSRIARALRDALAAEAHTAIRWQCSPYHADSALWPAIRQLSSAAAITATDTTDERLDRLEALLARGTHDVAATAPLVADLMGIDGTGRYGPLDLVPQVRRARTLAALTAQLLGLAQTSPVLFVCEDAHWIDPTTSELIGQALERIAAARVLMLLTSRPAGAPDLSAHPHVTHLALNRLGRAGVAAIVARLGGDSLSTEVIDAIIARTDGIPLFVEEVTRTVLETGETAIPATLHDTLMARLDRLPEVKAVAQTASCIGREFSTDLLAAIAEKPAADLTAAVDSLVTAGLVFRRSGIPDAYTFKHALVRDAAYESLLKSRRRDTHARIAAALVAQFPGISEAVPELPAHHYTEAGLAGAAVTYWQKAGEHAAARSAHVEAVAHLESGLALLEKLSDPAEKTRREIALQTALGAVLIPLKGQAASEVGETFARAETLCRQGGDSSKLYAVLQGLWHHHAVRAELDRARKLAEHCREIAARDGDPAQQLAASVVLCGSACWAGDFEAARDHLDTALAMADRAPRRSEAYSIRADLRVFMRGFGSYALWYLGDTARAVNMSEEAATLAAEAGDPFSRALALDHGAMLHQFGRDTARVAKLATEAIAFCTEHRFAYYRARAVFLEGWAHAAGGDVHDGIARMRHGLADLDATSTRLRRPYFLALLAEPHIEAGRPSDGLAMVEEAIALADETGERWRDADLQRVKGRLLLALGRDRADRARACFESALATARRQNAGTMELRAATSLAALLSDQGERRKARDVLASVHDRFAGGPETADVEEARVLLDALA